MAQVSQICAIGVGRYSPSMRAAPIAWRWGSCDGLLTFGSCGTFLLYI